jgi:hypothetical protein
MEKTTMTINSVSTAPINFRSVTIDARQPAAELFAPVTTADLVNLTLSLPEHVPSEVIVKLKPEFAFSGADVNGVLGGFAQDYGAEVGHRFDIPDNMVKSFNGEMMVLKLPAGVSTAQAMAAMAHDKSVGQDGISLDNILIAHGDQ